MNEIRAYVTLYPFVTESDLIAKHNEENVKKINVAKLLFFHQKYSLKYIIA